MKLTKNLFSPKIGRVDFCEASGTVSTSGRRSHEIREQVRDEVARIIGRY